MFKVRLWSMHTNNFVNVSSVIGCQELLVYAHAQKWKVCQCQAMGGIAMEYYINACERANMNFYTPMKICKNEKKHATWISGMSRSKSEGK